MGVRIRIAVALQAILLITSAQTKNVYTGANSNYFDSNRNNYATYGSAGVGNKGGYAGNLNNNVFNKDNRAFTGDATGFNSGFSKNAQGRDNSYVANSGLKNNVYDGSGGSGKYFSSSTSNNKDNNGGFSRDGAFTTSSSTTNGKDGTLSKSYSGNLNDVKEAFGDIGVYKDGQEGIQAAVNSFGSGSLGGVVGPKAFDYSKQARPNVGAYAAGGRDVFGNNLNVGYVDSFLNPQVSNQGDFGGYNQYKDARVFRPVEIRESNTAGADSYVKRPYAPVITNSYTPPTTYSGFQGAEGDSFFQVANPLSNKQAVISGYRPSNNFVDPSHFIIPKQDKYEMVDQLFGGGLSQFGQRGDAGLAEQPFKSSIREPRYSNIDDGLKNLGHNYHNDNNHKSDFNLGFFDDDKSSFKPGKQFIAPLKNSPKPSIQSYTDKGQNEASYRSGQGYQNQNGFSDHGRQNYDNSYDLKSSTGNIEGVSRNQGQAAAYQPVQGINSLKGAPPLDAIPQGPAPYAQPTGSLLKQQPRSDLFNKRQQGQFSSVPRPSLRGNTYQSNSVFDKRQDLTPTPLFTGFSPNKRITVNEFQNKNLLGDDSFGQTEYDRKRPTSTSALGSDLYRQSSFGNQKRVDLSPTPRQPFKQALQTNTLSKAPTFSKQSAPSQSDVFAKGGDGYKLVAGKTQTVGSSYDDGNSLKQGYTNSFDDSKSNAVGGRDNGGFAAYTAKGSFVNGNTRGIALGSGPETPGSGIRPDQGSYTKTYQSSDSYADDDGYSTGKSYSDTAGYRDGATSAGQYSTQDEDKKDFRDGYEREQSANDRHTYSNTDGYNNGFADGKKYDQSDGYSDNINYSNKNSDASQAHYTTGDGYKDGVDKVKSAVSGRGVNPYAGVRDSPKTGLSQNANYKPFDVNGQVSFFGYR
ncbi:hypothetical protein ElyMa_002734100 [Elysia marginata]|uniref:Uncharacterized protein n=1 Tax=Elysia marginata TaxID=1093978 RepID=A0AAV4HJU3_9GAST|nr:hypothetical protein ElyMa_002734100 [Elysia marginata]